MSNITTAQFGSEAMSVSESLITSKNASFLSNFNCIVRVSYVLSPNNLIRLTPDI